jgi:prepilin-type N-terminal cleavage/methylation domain-containing protein
LIRRLHIEERGYSLVEVMVSIIILAIAIIPMVGMLDMGLRSATASSSYDKARTLANLKMEEAKSLPFDSSDTTVQDLKDNFPEASSEPPTAYTAGTYETPTWKTVTGPASVDFTNFHYKVRKQYMAQPSQTPGSASQPFNTSASATSLIKVTVVVGWGTFNGANYSKTYTTFGLVTK